MQQVHGCVYVLYTIESVSDVVVDGDLVIVTKGDHDNLQGGTNGLKVLRVGDS